MHVDVLGPVRLRVDGRSRVLRSRAQRCLLGLLAVRPGATVSRDTLVEALWGTRPPRDPRHALQAHVSRLRRALPQGQRLLAATTHGYELRADDVTVDAHAFVDAVRTGRAELRDGRAEQAAATLGDALDLWRGEAFGDVADVPHLAAESTRLESLRLTALEDRVEADLQRRHDPSALVAELESLVRTHPLRERLWCGLMLAQDACGQRADALATFRRARAVLAEEAGLDPGPQLVSTHASLLRAPSAPLPEPAGATEATPSEATASGTEPDGAIGSIRLRHLATTSPPLVGREAERALLLDRWHRCDDGLQVVFVAGPPGIGKTRLATQLAADVHERGGIVRHGRCDRDPATPLQPFTEMLHEHLAAAPADMPAEDEPLARLLPERLPAAAGSGGDQQVEHRRLLDAISAWLARIAAERPLLLVLDDLQWADPATLAVVRHLARAPDPMVRGLLLATHRHLDDDTGLDPLVTDLGRDQHRVRRMRLGGLDEVDIITVFTEQLDVAEPSRLSHTAGARLHHLTGGNPFLAIELARHIDDQHPEATPAAIEAALDDVPPSVREIVGRTATALHPSANQVLECAAIAGDTFDVRVVHGASDLPAADADAALANLTRQGLLTDADGPRRRFVHGLVRAAIVDDLPPLRRLHLHDRVGRAMERVHGPDLRGHHERLAHHFAMADTDRDRVATYATRAGHDALHQHAPQRAVEHFDRAMAAAGPAAEVDQRLDLLVWRGLARLRAGDPGFRDDLLLAGRAADEAGDVDRLVHAATLNSRGWNSRTAGIDADRVALLETALRRLPDGTDARSRARVLAALAVEEVADPARRATAIRRSEDAVCLARTVDEPRLLAEVLEQHHVTTFAAFHQPWRATATTIELVRLADALRDPAVRMVADRCHAQASLLVGDVPTSDHHLERALRDVATLDHPPREWLTRSWWALRLLTRGRFEEAEREVVAAFELGGDCGQPDAMTWFGGQLFVLRDAQGRLGELVDLLAERLREDGHTMPTWRAGQALALCETGRIDEAAAILDTLVGPDGVALPTDLVWLVGAVHLARVAVGTRRRDAAEVLLDALAPYTGLVASNAVVDAGPVDTQLGALAALLGRQRQAEEAFGRAARLCASSELPVWHERLRRAREVTAPT